MVCPLPRGIVGSMSVDITDPRAFAPHSPYSDPGRHLALVQNLDAEVGGLCATTRNLIGHYRAELTDLPEARRGEIDSRWAEAILDLDQSRQPADLTEPRPLPDRIAGCCRDHSLMLISFLRTHGVPARSVVGFAGYFAPPFHHDHVVVDYFDGTRWVRTDPELDNEWGFDFDVRDMPKGAHAPFETAAEVWQVLRSGNGDPAQYGVDPQIPAPLRGIDFVAGYVVFQVAHRYGDELLLWDDWFTTPEPEVLDRLAALLVAADGGDAEAERALHDWYTSDETLHPKGFVMQHSPYGTPSVRVNLTTREVTPA